jgi:RND family efflux transporter MFP subunit
MAWIPRKWRRWVTLALVLASAVVGTLLLEVLRYLKREDPSIARQFGEPVPVRTALVTEGEPEQVIGATCVTLPSRTVTVRLGQINAFSANISSSNFSQVSDMVVKTVFVKQGDYVRKGQPILELKEDLLEFVHKQRKAAVANAKAELDRTVEEVKYLQKLREINFAGAQADVKYRGQDLDNKRHTLDAYNKMSTEGAAAYLDLLYHRSLFYQATFALPESQRTLQRADITLKLGPYTDRELLTKAESGYEAAAASLKVFEYDLERLKVQSPLEGFIDFGPNPYTSAQAIEPLVPGAVLTQTTSVAQVYQVDPIHVRLDYPQERLDDLVMGQKVDVVLDSYPKETFHGEVVQIGGQVNANLRVLPVDVAIQNTDHRIRGGISGYARIRVRKRSVLVPAMAVIRQGEKSMVFRVENGRARIREVRTGPLAEMGQFEVRGGLEPGDEVVIYEGFYSHGGELVKKDIVLKDDDRVDTNWKRWAKRE